MSRRRDRMSRLSRDNRRRTGTTCPGHRDIWRDSCPGTSGTCPGRCPGHAGHMSQACPGTSTGYGVGVPGLQPRRGRPTRQRWLCSPETREAPASITRRGFSLSGLAAGRSDRPAMFQRGGEGSVVTGQGLLIFHWKINRTITVSEKLALPTTPSDHAGWNAPAPPPPTPPTSDTATTWTE